MFRRLVNVVEALAAIGVVVALVLLFANEPDSGGGSTPQTPGAAVYASDCASCHGANGEGGVGPQLADGAVVKQFPSVDEQIAFVREGSGSMPAFGGQLSPAQIRQVVEYTRTL
jgi:mono/diheme cytochrome c family protein